MSLTLFVDETCPKCRKPIKQSFVELHPSNSNLAIQNFQCADCGTVKSRLYSLQLERVAV